MRWIFSLLLLCAITALASGNEGKVMGSVSKPPVVILPNLLSEELKQVLSARKATRFVLGESEDKRKIEAYYFPGRSELNALVIGGVHGSELSSIEVTQTLIKYLADGDSLYYNVIVIPCLFPDNAATARLHKKHIGSVKNIGRYSFSGAPDPNRQMPSPGFSLEEKHCLDHAGRKMESENVLLLQLIQEYKPQRIASVHAIHNPQYAGFFADPRTDAAGMALGYETDSLLALSMANQVELRGGKSPGNFLTKKPTTLYYKDPVAVAKGEFQQRNIIGASTAGQSKGGISLGTWGSTAVSDTADPSNNRDAIRIITIEFPGTKRPQDYTQIKQQQDCRLQIDRFAAAIRDVFLQELFVERTTL